MNEKCKTFHFTFGPVQGFVAHARRTRDLWGGSSLLSYLAGHAMVTVAENDGGILIPAVGNDPLFMALKEKSSLKKDHPAACLF